MFWKAAKSTVEGEFMNNMDEIRQIILGAYEHLVEKEGDVCPYAIKKMEEFGEELKFWRVHPSGQNEFEVRNGFKSYGVNIRKRVCACRPWDVLRIPCVHAQASIMLNH
uniref:SWIM-type domain-containing protein n=1 Tax=Lactuca sativa TaxID=4236 RepID=A0A9R1WVS3_LACSA|nr:hypothetical protein LSAT_V11C800430940 [Lactuca sativa]